MVYDKAKNSEFVKSPGMVGHHCAKEVFELAMGVYDKYATDDFRKIFFEAVVKDSDSWNYWIGRIGKKYVSQLRYVLRRLGKVPMTSLLIYKFDNSSLLKDELTWALEILSYVYDRENYYNYYTSCCGFYGMKRGEAIERLDKYVDDLSEKESRMKVMVDKLMELGEKEK